MTQPHRGRIVVAGATGYLGRHVAQALHADGWRVRALKRPNSSLGEAEATCDEVFVGEATRPETLQGLFANADAAFSSVGIRHFRRRPTYDEVDRQANLNLAEAAEQAGVRQFGFVSVLDGATLRHASPLIEARETVVDRLHASPMHAVILRPTGFFNDMAEMFNMARKGRIWLIGSGTTRINPIHGADLADVAVEAFREGHASTERTIGGPEVFTQQDIATLAATVLQRPVRISHAPAWLLTGAASMVSLWNQNAGALLKMFAQLGVHDAVGDRVGTHRLGPYFRTLMAQSAME